MSETRAKRENAGRRLKLFLENKEQFEEDEFWAEGGEAAEYFKEEEGDEEFDQEAAAEEEPEDTTDSDIDDEDEEDSEEEEQKAAEEDKRLQRAEARSKRRNVYVDPALVSKAKRQKIEAKAAKEAKEEESSAAEGEEENAEAEENAEETAEGTEEPKADEGAAKKEAQTIPQRTLRQSTVEYSNQRKAMRALEEEEKQRRAQTKTKRPKAYRKLTQEELLREAKKTEKMNIESLKNLIRIEEEKKKVTIHKPKVEGPVVSILSNQQGTFVSWSDPSTMPKQFNAPPPPYPAKLICDVTGLPAKYIDPKTKRPFATVEAFKIIRQKSQ